jgi:hypothetical protein
MVTYRAMQTDGEPRQAQHRGRTLDHGQEVPRSWAGPPLTGALLLDRHGCVRCWIWSVAGLLIPVSTCKLLQHGARDKHTPP